jgi:hypothetical protein
MPLPVYAPGKLLASSNLAVTDKHPFSPLPYKDLAPFQHSDGLRRSEFGKDSIFFGDRELEGLQSNLGVTAQPDMPFPALATENSLQSLGLTALMSQVWLSSP